MLLDVIEVVKSDGELVVADMIVLIILDLCAYNCHIALTFGVQ